MKTLYELLGALPDDDAERIRAAYRRAARANHPDNNPGDPDAPHRFRQIVHAYAILRDERQRAMYDRLLGIARQQQGLERGISSSPIRKIAPDAIAIAILSVAFIGGFLLLGDMFKAPLFSAPVNEVSEPEPAQTAAATPTEPSDTVGQTDPRDKPRDVAAPDAPAAPEAFKEAATKEAVTKEAATPEAAAPAETTGSVPAIDNVPAVRDFGVNDARYYRERGVLAYRSGDLYLALVNFNLAIELDPNFLDAYVDRAIVFHRMGDLERAFADIARANRVDASRANEIPPAASAR
jgi:curved DNA-binding protein CbpA